jgi:cell division protein ZapA
VKQTLQVSILGQQFNLRSDASPEQVQKIAEFVEGQIHQVTDAGRVADSLQAAILALLNVSARYLQAGEAGAGSSLEDERLRLLVGRIERVLGDQL